MHYSEINLFWIWIDLKTMWCSRSLNSFTSLYYNLYNNQVKMTDINIVDAGTMRQEASDQAWSEALSPKWPLPELCKPSWIWNTPTPPCSPGRSETGCCWMESVTRTVCPASAPSTGTEDLKLICLCLTTQVLNLRAEWTCLCLCRIIRNKVQSDSYEVGKLFFPFYSI